MILRTFQVTEVEVRRRDAYLILGLPHPLKSYRDHGYIRFMELPDDGVDRGSWTVVNNNGDSYEIGDTVTIAADPMGQITPRCWFNEGFYDALFCPPNRWLPEGWTASKRVKDLPTPAEHPIVVTDPRPPIGCSTAAPSGANVDPCSTPAAPKVTLAPITFDHSGCDKTLAVQIDGHDVAYLHWEDTIEQRCTPGEATRLLDALVAGRLSVQVSPEGEAIRRWAEAGSHGKCPSDSEDC